MSVAPLMKKCWWTTWKLQLITIYRAQKTVLVLDWLTLFQLLSTQLLYIPRHPSKFFQTGMLLGSLFDRRSHISCNPHYVQEKWKPNQLPIHIKTCFFNFQVCSVLQQITKQHCVQYLSLRHIYIYVLYKSSVLIWQSNTYNKSLHLYRVLTINMLIMKSKLFSMIRVKLYPQLFMSLH